MQDKLNEMLNYPDKKEHFKQIAREKGIRVEKAAKEHLSKLKDK